MARYQIDDVIVDAKNATDVWKEDTRWNGRNHIGIMTGSQWDRQTLRRSAKGHYWIEHVSAWQGSQPTAWFVTDEEAALWLLACGHELPEALEKYEEKLVE